MRRLFACIILVFSMSLSNAQNTNGDQLFNDNHLHIIKFEDVDIQTFTNTKDYQQLKMIIDDTEVDSIGFKRKGNISAYYSPDKFGIKIKTNKYVKGKKYDGIKEFTLHINYQDPSMLREKLTYDLCMDLGLYSLRTAFAKVYLNDEYWGVYTIVEGKDEMYKQIFDNRDMDAIESLDFGTMCYISDNPQDYDYENNDGNPTYQLENGDANTAWPRFAQMINKANNTPSNQYINTVSNYLNLEDFFKYQAINVYLMNMDSYLDFRGNQIYIYDEEEDLWQIQPWDFNASFGLWNTNNYSPDSYPIIPNSISDGCIAEKMNEVSELKSFYLDAMCNLQNILGNTNNYFNQINNWKEQIQQAVYDDDRKHFTNSDFDKGTEYGYLDLFGENIPALKTFIQERNAVIEQGLFNENHNCESTGTFDANNIQTLKIFPNPTQNYIQINSSLPDLIPYELFIYNHLGQLITQKQYNLNTVDIQFLQNGFYILKIRTKNEEHIFKLIKE